MTCASERADETKQLRSLVSEMDASVWERSRITVMGGNYTEICWWQTLFGHFKMTITFQMLWNEISVYWLVRLRHPIAQSHITFLMRMVEFTRQMHFHLLLFALTLFRKSKPTSSESKTFFCQLSDFILNLAFPSLVSDVIGLLQNAH